MLVRNVSPFKLKKNNNAKRTLCARWILFIYAYKYIHTYRRQDAADIWLNIELCTCLVCIKFNLLYTVALKLCDRIRYEMIDPYA